MPNYANKISSSSNTSSLKEQLIVETMSRVAWETYSLYFEKNAALVNQKLDVMRVVDFDEQLTWTSAALVEALAHQRDLYIWLGQEKIDLGVLATRGRH